MARMKFVRYEFPFRMANVAGAVMGAFWGTFLRRFTGHVVLQTILVLVGILVIWFVLGYRPTFQEGPNAPSPQSGGDPWRAPPSLKGPPR